MSWTLQSSCPWTGQSWTSRPWTLAGRTSSYYHNCADHFADHLFNFITYEKHYYPYIICNNKKLHIIIYVKI